MAWMLRGYVDVCWVPEGTGGTAVMPTGGLANEPGYGAAMAAGAMPTGQTLRVQVAEPITGLNGAGSPTSANVTAAATQLGTDVGTFLTNNLTTIQGWGTGLP
jgi:hypothetical protein